MPQDNRSGPPSKGPKPGGDRRDDRGGGGRGGGKGGPRKGGFGKGPSKPVRVETYESLKEIVRGVGFRIDKFMVAEKGTGRPVKTEYRLIREGLDGPKTFDRLAEAQNAATAPLPEPELEAAPESEVAAEPIEQSEEAAAVVEQTDPIPSEG